MRFVYPNRVHDGVNQAKAGSLGELLRLQQQLAAVRSDRFVGFDAAEDKVLVAQVAERRDENPLQRGLPPVIGLASLRVGRRLLEPLEAGALRQDGLQHPRHPPPPAPAGGAAPPPPPADPATPANERLPRGV